MCVRVCGVSTMGWGMWLPSRRMCVVCKRTLHVLLLQAALCGPKRCMQNSNAFAYVVGALLTIAEQQQLDIDW